MKVCPARVKGRKLFPTGFPKFLDPKVDQQVSRSLPGGFVQQMLAEADHPTVAVAYYSMEWQ